MREHVKIVLFVLAAVVVLVGSIAISTVMDNVVRDDIVRNRAALADVRARLRVLEERARRQDGQ